MKEKYGELTVGVIGSFDPHEGVTGIIESMSAWVHIDCGRPGRSRYGALRLAAVQLMLGDGERRLPRGGSGSPAQRRGRAALNRG